LKSEAWRNPGFKQDDDHPVVNVTWREAEAFCKWLTEKERKGGQLKSNELYRLPTDLEWSKAVALPAETGATPEERDMGVQDVYPWGKTMAAPGRCRKLRRGGKQTEIPIPNLQRWLPEHFPSWKIQTQRTGFFTTWAAMSGNGFPTTGTPKTGQKPCEALLVQRRDTVEPLVVLPNQFLAGHSARHLWVSSCEGHRGSESQEALRFAPSRGEFCIASPRARWYRSTLLTSARVHPIFSYEESFQPGSFPSSGRSSRSLPRQEKPRSSSAISACPGPRAASGGSVRF